jgi:hypothetical protein
MFTKPLSQVEYSDVESFCNTFGEGVRVEYKSEMIENIPKAISAFANTLGGIIVIGVEADKVQNKVVAINGTDNKEGIEESILNSSLNGIYPSVIPEVKILEIPEKKNKILVVIKVHESIEAPHAIQNSTRVYIRTGSTSQPYELAEIDRIEYLLKRREKPAKRREELRQKAHERLIRLLGISELGKPYLYVSISPVFPYQPLISLDELYVFCNAVPYNSTVYPNVDNPQRIADGICKFAGNADNFWYTEINHYGFVFISDALEKMKPRRIRSNQEGDENFDIRFAHFVWTIGRALKLAEMFYNKCGYLGNCEVKVNVENIANECLLYNEQGVPPINEYKSIDNSTFSSKVIVVEDINSKLLDIVTSLTRNILWAFDCPATDSQQRGRVEEILVANRMIKKE